MKTKKLLLSAIVIFAVSITGCSKSDECDILSVKDGDKVWAKKGTDFEGTYAKDDNLSNVNLTIKVSSGATYAPKGPYNFVKDGNITLTVTSKSGKKTQKFNLKPKT